MTQLGEAIARYHKLLETEPFKDTAWAEALLGRMQSRGFTAGGNPIAPVLRPHFITRRQYTNLVKAAESLFSAIDRIKQLALSSPQLLSRMELLPAEKMLASVDPGYPFLAVTSLLDTHLDNGTMHFVEYNADTPAGVAYSDGLAEVFYDCPPMRQFRKRYAVSKPGGMKHLLEALLRAYREFTGGGKKLPHIAIVEIRQPTQSTGSGELLLMQEFFRREGYPAEIVAPEQLEYRNGVLRRGDFRIDLVYRRVKAQEFLVRYSLDHPLVRAYRDRAACVVNSFRSELAHKKAIFDLLTDDAITAGFPLAERKAIHDYIPWTRVVSASKVTYRGELVDLPEFIVKNRERLVLKPNDDSAEQHSFHGWEVDARGWERALKTAMRHPYVVQERVPPPVVRFPVYKYGEIEMRDMEVDLHPHAFLGRVQGCSTWLTVAGAGSFSTLSGLAATFVVEPR